MLAEVWCGASREASPRPRRSNRAHDSYASLEVLSVFGGDFAGLQPWAVAATGLSKGVPHASTLSSPARPDAAAGLLSGKSRACRGTAAKGCTHAESKRYWNPGVSFESLEAGATAAREERERHRPVRPSGSATCFTERIRQRERDRSLWRKVAGSERCDGGGLPGKPSGVRYARAAEIRLSASAGRPGRRAPLRCGRPAGRR
jgi:hypothetical protein